MSSEMPKQLGDGRFLFHHRIVVGAEASAFEQIGDAHAAAADLVFVAGADAARGGADGDAARARPSDIFSIMRCAGNSTWARLLMKRLIAHVDAGGFERIDFVEQRGRIEHQAVADHRLLAGAQNAARDQLQVQTSFRR